VASSIIAAPFAHPARPDLLQFAELGLFGIAQLGLGLLLLTAGTKRLSASRVALVGGLDVPLAPIWVWLAFNEIPSPATIAGGLMVIAAVTLNTVLHLPTAKAAGAPTDDDLQAHSEAT
jgi:drug/metabolite transporter (DMT)-like permease